MLGMGFAQALSNVDRHNIQRRIDAKRYAFGVLGVGSLRPPEVAERRPVDQAVCVTSGSRNR